MKRALAILVVSMVVLGLLVSGISCTKTVYITATTTPTPALSPAPSPTPTLSEQPDKATFQKYFSEMGLGTVPAGATGPQDLQRNVTFFTAGDQMCLYFNIIQECQTRDAIYDVETKKVIKEGGLPKPMIGGVAGWRLLAYLPGNMNIKSM